MRESGCCTDQLRLLWCSSSGSRCVSWLTGTTVRSRASCHVSCVMLDETQRRACSEVWGGTMRAEGGRQLGGSEGRGHQLRQPAGSVVCHPVAAAATVTAGPAAPAAAAAVTAARTAGA